MFKNNIFMFVSIYLFLYSTTSLADVPPVPPVTGEPIIVEHLGIIDWPADNKNEPTPYLTQKAANDINDLHGVVSCDLIISTPGNYHMALRDAMKGRPDLGHAVGLQEQIRLGPGPNVTVCWSTSPPVSVDQIAENSLHFKNIKLKGRPALAMAPGGVMDQLIANNVVKVNSVKPFLKNRGNVMLIRADKVGVITNVCNLDGATRVVTPNPYLEPGSFTNFSDTIFNVAHQNPDMGCSNDTPPGYNAADVLFNGIFSQDTSLLDLTKLDNPHDIDGVMSVFGRGTAPQGTGAKWVASSRIMHRDIPYALCNDQADVGVIFYHQAIYLRDELNKGSGCKLRIVPLGGTVANPNPLPGNKEGALKIAKVKGSFSQAVVDARNLIYNFLTNPDTMSPWARILAEHGMDQP